MNQSELDAADSLSEASSLHGEDHETSGDTSPTAQGYVPLKPPSTLQEGRSPQVSTPQTSEPEGEKKDEGNRGFARPLDTHPLGVWLVLLYSFAAIFSWTVTCVLSHRPIGTFGQIEGGPTYYDQSGKIWRINYINSERWRQAASIGSAIVSAVGIPVTSAICAGATAVYCQRKSKVKMPSLTLRQTLALADKGWSDLGVIRNLIRPSTSHKTRSALLLFSMGLVVLAFVIPVLESALVKSIHVQVSSFEDGLQNLGAQMTPGELRQLDAQKVMPSVISATTDSDFYEKQPFMWVEGAGNANVTSPAEKLGSSSNLGNLTNEVFISNYPIGTDTGIVRVVVLRSNTTVSCELIQQSSFPTSCEGNNPLNRTYTNIDEPASEPFGDLQDPRFRVRLCAPGDTLASPWNESGSRQDITEEFFLDFESTNLTNRMQNFTQHCSSQTSLGFFELPNYWNGHEPGPLLPVLPPQTSPNKTYFDSSFPEKFTGLDDDPIQTVPGPFLTSVLAIFGNNTFFDTVASNSNYTDSNGLLCNQLRHPFVKLAVDNEYLWINAVLNGTGEPARTATPRCEGLPNQKSNSSLLLYALLDWIPNFGNVEAATAAFTLAAYSANTAILNPDNSPVGFRTFVFASPGYSIQKPAISLSAMIAISVILALQLIGLVLLAVWGSRRSTWTPSLNAFALLRMGAALHDELPLMSSMKAAELEILDEKPGWIGGEGQRLVVGGSENLVPRRKYRMVEDEGGWLTNEKGIGTWKGVFCGGYTDANGGFLESSFERRKGGHDRSLKRALTREEPTP